ncbi:hypothetical protein ACHAXS_011996 [Conticribra weissflogii]
MKYISNMQEWTELMESSKEKLVVVDFTATWCPPCRMIGPIFEAMANEFPDALFVKVDVDAASDIAQQCGIRAMPTFQFYKNGAKVNEFSGASEQKLRETEKLVVVDFTASWCGPCQRIAPRFEAFAETYPNASFVKVDVDAQSDIAQECGIRAMPTFQFYRDGRKVDELTGADVAALEEKIRALV